MRLIRLCPVVFVLAVTALGSCRRSAPAPEARPLRILMGQDVATLDPQVPWDEVSSVVLDNIFESLVRFDRSFRLTSGLAKRWINPDDRTWRFVLDPEARFPDGTSLRASDVRFSIERLRSLAGSHMGGFTRHISDTEVVDDLTIDVHTDIPIAILNSLAFIPIMSERHVQAVGDRVAERPFGTGPYQLVRWEKGKSLLLEANPHHRPAPAIRSVEFSVRDDPRILDDVLRLRPDIALFLRLDLIEELAKRRPQGLRIVSGGGLAVFYAAFNLRPEIPGRKGRNPLADLRVRRALARAIDVAELVRDGARGFGRPATQLIVPPVFGFDPLVEPIPNDPKAARELLAQAGHTGFELPMSVPRGGTHTLERVLIRQWEKVGVRGVLQELADDELQRSLDSGRFAVSVLGYSCTSADASEMLAYALHSRDTGKGYGMGNYGGYRSRELDRVSAENLSLFDPKRRLETLQNALRLAAAELPYLPLFVAENVYVVSDAIDWTPPVNEEVRVTDVTLKARVAGGP